MASSNPLRRELRHEKTSESLILAYRTLSDQASSAPLPIKGTKEQSRAPITVHLLSLERVCQYYNTHPTLGLTPNAFARPPKKLNKLSPPPSNDLKKWINYIFGGFNALMWIAMILSILSYKPLGELNGGTPQIFNLGVGILIAFVIIISAAFYAYVDYSANQVMKSIELLSTDQATVIRNGTKVTIPAKELRVGDVVVVALGQKVPADLYIFEASYDLRFDKSLLTGESDPVQGTTTCTDENPLETKNLALSSTLVVQGSMTGIVFAVGDDTVVGQVVQLTASDNPKTNLQKELEFFSIVISALAVTMFCISMIFWYYDTRVKHPGYATLGAAILNAIGCLTACVPQGLPVCVGLSLTIVARRMAAKSVLVKNLAVVETVGSMSILCSDKTGTLTEGQMFVNNVSDGLVEINASEKLWSTKGGAEVLEFFTLCNDAYLNGDSYHGNATDVALLRFAQESKTASKWKKIFSLPFNSKNKYMATVATGGGESVLLVKGAPDVLMEKVSKMKAFTGQESELLLNEVQELQKRWSKKGERVLVICSKKIDLKATIPNGNIEDFIEKELNGMTLLALVGITDPPRKTVPKAVADLRSSGIRVVMITGDFKDTAESIARQVGIITAPEVCSFGQLSQTRYGSELPMHLMKPSISSTKPVKAIVINGPEVSKMQKEHFDTLFTDYEEIVFARTTPEQKMNIVLEAKKRGDSVVGVTGDGVNDAPALKAADVGIAMGAGSDVAKQAADIVLLTNDFASILLGVENGRLVFENLKKVLLYVMPTGTYTQLVTIIATVFLGVQTPLSSYLQVAFSIFNDVSMAISIMYEKAESDLMKRRPRNIRLEKLVNWQLFFQIYAFQGLFTWIFCFGSYFYYWSTLGIKISSIIGAWDNWSPGYLGYSGSQLDEFVSVSQGIFYVAMTVMQLGNILIVRNRRVGIFESNPISGPRKNHVLFGSVAVHLFVTCANVYISSAPGNPNLFKIGFVPLKFWLIPLPFAFLLVVFDEIRKWIVRRNPNGLISKTAW